jgi:hypothetical protein
VAIRATRRVANHNDPTAQCAETNDPRLAIVLALVFDFESRSSEHKFGIVEIQAARGKVAALFFGSYVIATGYCSYGNSDAQPRSSASGSEI